MIRKISWARLRHIGLLVCLLFWNFGVIAQNADVARLVKAGAQKYQAGDLDGAITAYRQALALQSR